MCSGWYDRSILVKHFLKLIYQPGSHPTLPTGRPNDISPASLPPRNRTSHASTTVLQPHMAHLHAYSRTSLQAHHRVRARRHLWPVLTTQGHPAHAHRHLCHATSPCMPAARRGAGTPQAKAECMTHPSAAPTRHRTPHRSPPFCAPTISSPSFPESRETDQSTWQDSRTTQTNQGSQATPSTQPPHTLTHPGPGVPPPSTQPLPPTHPCSITCVKHVLVPCSHVIGPGPEPAPGNTPARTNMPAAVAWRRCTAAHQPPPPSHCPALLPAPFRAHAFKRATDRHVTCQARIWSSNQPPGRTPACARGPPRRCAPTHPARGPCTRLQPAQLCRHVHKVSNTPVSDPDAIVPTPGLAGPHAAAGGSVRGGGEMAWEMGGHPRRAEGAVSTWQPRGTIQVPRGAHRRAVHALGAGEGVWWWGRGATSLSAGAPGPVLYKSRAWSPSQNGSAQACIYHLGAPRAGLPYVSRGGSKGGSEENGSRSNG